MSKKNKLMIGLSSTAIPLLAAVSAKCGVDKDYEELEKDAKEILVGATFSAGKPQWNSLASLINYYNENHKNDKHFLPVRPVHLGSGYAEGENTIIKDLEAEKKETVSLTFNYASLASKLASNKIHDKYKRDKILNFEDDDKEISINLKNISEAFTVANSSTENLPKKGTYIIPAFKSINVMSANAPVLHYIFKTLKEKGAQFDESFLNSDRYKKIMKEGSGDEEEVKKLWGDFVESQASAVKNLKISNSTFEHFDELLTFADIAQKSFKNSATDNSRLHILGVDDVAGLVQTLPYSMIGASFKDFYIQTRNVNGKTKINYHQIKDSNNKSVQALAKIYNKFKDSLQTRSLTLLAGGEYTSAYQTKHEYAFGIGSTAGYGHNFIKGSDKKVIITLKKDKSVSGEKGMEFRNVIKSDSNNAKVSVISSSGHANNIYNSTVDTSKLSDKDKKSLKYSFKSLDSSTDAKLDEIYNKLQNSNAESSNNKRWILFLNEDKKDDINAAKKQGATEIGSVIETKSGDASKYKILFFENETNLEKKELSSKGTLQENELFAFAVPGKWDKSNKKRVIYSQGPSLIGISRGARPDRAAKNFAKFLTSSNKIDITLGNYKEDNTKTKDIKKYTQVTPAFFISDTASYVFPVKGFENTDTSKYKNKYIVHTYNELKETVKNKNVVIYEEPAGFYSSAFREGLGSAFKSAYLKAKNKQQLVDFNQEIISTILSSSGDVFKN